MSSPRTWPLTPFDQTEIVRALPIGGPAGRTHEIHLAIRGRRICVNAAFRPAAAPNGQAAFSAVSARRAEARADRLLPVIATGCHDGCYWIAYEYGAAVPLASEGWRRWPAAAAVDLLSAVARAVDDAASQAVFAHEFGPGSVFVDPRVGPLVGDFGSAREAFGNPSVEEERMSAFVPPEVSSLGRADARSGVYAAGALLYALLSGGPPTPEPVTHWRPDLADGINLVLARAMAPDSLERYPTASELCDNARRALARQVASPAGPRPKLDPAPPMEIELAEADDYQWRPPEPRFARPLRAGVVLAAVALAAVAGAQLGTSDAPASAAGADLLGNGASITLPRGWSAGVPRGDEALSAYPSTDWFSGLTVRLSARRGSAPDRSDPVRLGQLTMWRDRTSVPRVVRYTAPTTTGTLVVSCEAASGGARTVLSQCERALSTLRLQNARLLPLPGVVREPGTRMAVKRLGRSRRIGRSRLARAHRPNQQREAAAALARVYEQAARRFANLDTSAGAAAGARRAANAYRDLAAATGANSTHRWATAAESVRRAETELAKRLGAR
jgi:hypothetical protein